MTNNQLAENSVNQLLNSVRLARDNAEREDNRVDHSFYYALAIALEELQERRKDDSEPVTQDEREAFEAFMAKRFGDLVDQRRAKNGDYGYMAWDMVVAWTVWQARAATLQAEPVKTANKLGNSPVIPDGYVMVPKVPTAEMQSAGASAIRIETTALNKLWTGNAVFRAMLAAAPQEVQGE